MALAPGIVALAKHLPEGFVGSLLGDRVGVAQRAFTWTGVFFGMLVRSPDAMQGVGFIIILPLSFMAGTFVPIAGLDAVPRAIADWDPISALVA